MIPRTRLISTALDPLDPALYEQDAAGPLLAALGRQTPIVRTRDTWVLLRHADVVHCLANPITLSSEGLTPPDARRAMHHLDPPRHGPVRRAAAQALGPLLPRLETALVGETTRIIESMVRNGGGDLAAALSVVPLTVTCELIGLPVSDGPWLRAQIEMIARGPNKPDKDAARHAIRARLRAQPGGVPSLAEGLDAEERVSLGALLAQAGWESSAHAISGTLCLLIEHPSEREKLLTGAASTAVAVEELLRFTSPIAQVPRTATASMELAGTRIAAGERVSLSLAAANFDADVFTKPDELDLARTKNPHLALGHGPHHCFGAQLARAYVRAAINAFITLPASVALAGPPLRTRSNFSTGVCRLPVQFGVTS